MRGRAKYAEIVTDLGMAPFRTGNLRTAAEALGVKQGYENLSPIRAALKSWAEKLYQNVREELSPIDAKFTT
jgi:hypothetical protein